MNKFIAMNALFVTLLSGINAQETDKKMLPERKGISLQKYFDRIKELRESKNSPIYEKEEIENIEKLITQEAIRGVAAILRVDYDQGLYSKLIDAVETAASKRQVERVFFRRHSDFLTPKEMITEVSRPFNSPVTLEVFEMIALAYQSYLTKKRGSGELQRFLDEDLSALQKNLESQFASLERTQFLAADVGNFIKAKEILESEILRRKEAESGKR